MSTAILQRAPDSAVPSPRPRQSPAMALAKRVAILREEMQHCLAKCAECEALHDAYLDEYLALGAQIDQLRPSMLASALRETRELMCRKHPHFAGAVAVPRPCLGDE